MYAAIRIRGLKAVSPTIRVTLESLNLDRKNHCVIVPDRKELEGMLVRARDYIAYGPVKEETLAQLLQKRGRLEGDKHITPEFMKQAKLNSFEDTAKALLEGKTTLKRLGIKPVFRLNSPRKGFPAVGIKRSVELKGPLGFHAEGMDDLLVQMM